jgi:hypothetical protein
MDTSSMIEAKKEYTSQLQQILSPRIYERFKFIFDGTIEIIKKELSMNHIQNESVIKIFQKQLVSIKDWNESSIIEEYERIKHRSKCNYLDKLIKAVIIANMKILSTIQYGGKRKSKIQVHIPTPTHFIHKCYIECAKEIYKNPYIFDMSTSLSSKEKHQNLRDSLILVDNGINSAIRQLLPISDLLEQNFNSDEEDEDDESSVQSSGDEEESNQSGGSVEEESVQSGVVEEESARSRSDSESSVESSVSSKSAVSSLSSNSASEDEEDEENNSYTSSKSSQSIVSATSSISSASSQSLGSKVGSVLNEQSIQDIDIRIGGDSETQTMLAGAVAERAEEHQTNFEESTPISQDSTQVQQVEGALQSGGFLGALYNTFASSKNIKPDATDAPAPIKPVIQSSFVTGGSNNTSVEEVKQIVYSGNAVPKGYTLSTPVVQTPVQSAPVVQQFGGEKPLFDMKNSIYPRKTDQSQSIKSSKSQSQGKIIKTIHRPLNGQKNGLSLREMKYGSKIKEYDNVSVKSNNSVKSVKSTHSVKSMNSDDFHF